MVGKDLSGVCKAIHSAARGLSAQALDDLKGWTCQFALHVLHALALVRSCSCCIYGCHSPCLDSDFSSHCILGCVHLVRHRHALFLETFLQPLVKLHEVNIAVQAFKDLHQTAAHRDVKPDNVMVTGLDNGRVGVKLVDWASSCSVNAGIHCATVYSVCLAGIALLCLQHLTQFGIATGTRLTPCTHGSVSVFPSDTRRHVRHLLHQRDDMRCKCVLCFVDIGTASS